VVEGDPPRVRFLDGRETHVAEGELRVVCDEDFDAEIANRSIIEVHMHRRVHGGDVSSLLWHRDSSGIWRPTSELSEPPCDPPGVMSHFVPDDLGSECDVVVSGPPELDCVTERG